MNQDFPQVGPAAQWLIAHGASEPSPASLLTGLAARLSEAGMALAHASLAVEELHPLFSGSRYVWQHDTGRTLEQPRFHGFLSERSSGGGADDESDDVREAGALGATDQIALLLQFSDGSHHAVTFASARAGGFSDADRAELRFLAQLLASQLEVVVQRHVATTLLETYLGKRSGAHVLAGLVKRGDGETIHAAIWVSDLRVFTALSERLARDDLINLLNVHFERLVAPIKAFGGEVLKFVGDGLLAIFPIAPGDSAPACRAAVNATRSAVTSTRQLNVERRKACLPTFRFGVALHVGDVMYGNIGSPDRLDFTVIGPAVNVATRLERLCKTLRYPVVASGAFAAASGSDFVHLGSHRLRGIAAPTEVYTLTELARTPARAAYS